MRFLGVAAAAALLCGAAAQDAPLLAAMGSAQQGAFIALISSTNAIFGAAGCVCARARARARESCSRAVNTRARRLGYRVSGSTPSNVTQDEATSVTADAETVQTCATFLQVRASQRCPVP